MTAPSLLHHVVYILNELVPWFILASVWILFHKDKFCQKTDPVCDRISIGDYQLQPSTHKILYKQEPLKTLSPKDFAVLYKLSEQMNRPVSRETLLQEIWHEQEAHDSLNNTISRLRKLLEKDTTLSLEMIKGVGYTLIEKIVLREASTPSYGMGD